MPRIFSSAYQIMRLGAPTGYLVAFFPAAFGTMLAYRSTQDLVWLLVFLLGSILVRSGGSIINDIWDQDFDRLVRRTKDRPLAKRSLTMLQTLIILALNLGGGLVILLSLNKLAITLGIVAFLLICIYPACKRFTNFPQVFLGLTINMGSLIAYAAIREQLDGAAIALYLACGCWAVAYDTIYAFMDLEDDKHAGVRSMARYLEHKNYQLILAILYNGFFISIICLWSSLLTTIGVFISAVIANVAIFTIDINNMQNCLVRFKMNNYIGFILLCSMLLNI